MAQFGSATVFAQSQTPEGTVANPAQPAFIVGSVCLVIAEFYDTTGAALIPSALQYRIDDVVSGAEILGWTTLESAATVQVIVTSAQNALITNSREWETHQVTFQVTDGLGDIAEPFTLFDILR